MNRGIGNLKNEFAEENIRVLAEYDVPSSAIHKILNTYGDYLKDLAEE